MTHEELVSLGVGPHSIARAIERQRLHRRHRGIYSLVDKQALPPLAREQAAVLACGKDTHLSRHSAAAAWGYRPPRAGPVEVTLVGRDAGRTRAGIRVHRTKSMDPRDLRTFGGIPITSPARTLVDIAPDLSDRELEKAFDEAMARGLITTAAVRAVLLGAAGRARCRAPACTGARRSKHDDHAL